MSQLISSLKISTIILTKFTGPGSSVGRMSALENGFNPGPRHPIKESKVFKMVLAAPRLALRLTG